MNIHNLEVSTRASAAHIVQQTPLLDEDLLAIVGSLRHCCGLPRPIPSPHALRHGVGDESIASKVAWSEEPSRTHSEPFKKAGTLRT